MLIERLGCGVRPSLRNGGTQSAIIVLVHRNTIRLAIDLAGAGDNDLAAVARARCEDVLGSPAVDEHRSERVGEDVGHSHGRSEMEHAVMGFDQIVDSILIEDGALDQTNRVDVRMLREVAAAPGGEIVEDGHRVTVVDQAVDEMAADEPSATGYQRLHAMAP